MRQRSGGPPRAGISPRRADWPEGRPWRRPAPRSVAGRFPAARLASVLGNCWATAPRSFAPQGPSRQTTDAVLPIPHPSDRRRPESSMPWHERILAGPSTRPVKLYRLCRLFVLSRVAGFYGFRRSRQGELPRMRDDTGPVRPKPRRPPLPRGRHLVVSSRPGRLAKSGRPTVSGDPRRGLRRAGR
jgi:hypothetical protein